METASFRNLRIGDILKEYKYVTDEQIQMAIEYQKEHKGCLLYTSPSPRDRG